MSLKNIFHSWLNELNQCMIYSRKTIYKGEEYLLLYDFNDGCYLGVKTKDEFPAQTYLIRLGKDDKLS